MCGCVWRSEDNRGCHSLSGLELVDLTRLTDFRSGNLNLLMEDPLCLTVNTHACSLVHVWCTHSAEWPELAIPPRLQVLQGTFILII